MKLVIRADKAFTIQSLMQPLGRLVKKTTVAGFTSSEQEWARIKQLAEPYRVYCDQKEWEREEAALATLLSVCPIAQNSLSLYIQEVPVPGDLPLPMLALMKGMLIREIEPNPLESSPLFSPYAMLWLREAGVKPLRTLSGHLLHIEYGDGLAILQFEDDYREEEIPLFFEQKNHQEEHIDEGMLLLQVNLDDISPEWLAYVMEQCLSAGANDVHFFPVTMKKSRPGTMIQVMCYQSQAEALKTILFSETTTFGIRSFPVACHRLARRFITVRTEWGEVVVKLGYHRQKRVQIAPEYAVCAKLAEKAGVPLKRVYQHAIKIADEESSVNLV
ncbi:nickel insertion protein [Brevibacillus sp. NRS-1366]|uniref:nickel insertion protein n=1 Tax=Brevibacillus sp. NRS-1366 TaxID=3233899 RepID=UPI003D1BD452